MKIKVSEASGPVLDWMVRYAQNGRPPVDYVPNRDNFSTCWNKGGQLLEREEIGVEPVYCDGEPDGWRAAGCDLEYDENGEYIDGSDHMMYGPTPLVAAMRCLVHSKLGEEVDVPEELK